MAGMEVPVHLARWMAVFLLDRELRIKIGDDVSMPGYPNGNVPQGTFSGSTHVLVHINDLQTSCPIYKYVDDNNALYLKYATKIWYLLSRILLKL